MMKRKYANALASELADELAEAGAVYIAGSIRRQKAEVKDIELVIVSDDLSDARAELDWFVNRGIIQKGEKWGETYRKFYFRDAPVDLFFAHPQNFGFIYWLRTGPGDKNTSVMTIMKNRRLGVRFFDGYAWEVAYDEPETGRDFRRVNRLALRSELHLYGLLGLEYIEPEYRTADKYHGMKINQNLLESLRIVEDTPIQRSLF